MKEKRESKKRRILMALLEGMRLTPDDANRIGKTNEGTRLIRFIREDYPVLKMDVAGESYKIYYLDPVWLEEYRKEHKKSFAERIGDFFENLLDGGMFGGRR